MGLDRVPIGLFRVWGFRLEGFLEASATWRAVGLPCLGVTSTLNNLPCQGSLL